VQAWIGRSFGFMLVQMLSLVQEVVVLVVGLESLPMVSLLVALTLVLNTGMGGVVAWSWKGGTVHGFLSVVLVLLWLVRGGSLIRVTMVVLSLLDILHLVINTSLGEVVVLRLRGGTNHCLSFVVLVLLQWDRSGLPMVVLGLKGWIAVLIGMLG
jgi:hypothetical protein